MALFFKNSMHKHEVIQSYSSQDMVVLALIERDQVEVGDCQRKNGRCALHSFYRCDGTDWSLIYRHADPLANGISLQQAARFARRSPPSE